MQASVCSDNDMSCMYRTCSNCKNKTFPTTLDPSLKENIIIWEEWVTKSVPKKVQVDPLKLGSEECFF